MTGLTQCWQVKQWCRETTIELIAIQHQGTQLFPFVNPGWNSTLQTIVRERYKFLMFWNAMAVWVDKSWESKPVQHQRKGKVRATALTKVGQGLPFIRNRSLKSLFRYVQSLQVSQHSNFGWKRGPGEDSSYSRWQADWNHHTLLHPPIFILARKNFTINAHPLALMDASPMVDPTRGRIVVDGRPELRATLCKVPGYQGITLL